MPNELVHTFAGNPLDRAEVPRRDEAWLQRASTSERAKFLALSRLKVCLHTDAGDGARLAWQPSAAFDLASTTWVLLGLDADEAPCFAIDAAETPAPDGCAYTDCRVAAGLLGGGDAGIVAQARAQLDWHRRNRYCGRCAAPTKMRRGGQALGCTACDNQIFPRTDPVVIMLVADDERCLLGQGAVRMPRMNIYSALAGFVDQAESIEEAVRREVREEAGIEVGAVHYHSSQPWPFSSSLMIGCLAEPETRDINFDTEEMRDVAWFSRDRVRDAFAGRLDHGLPGPIAIAHHLIMHWLEAQP
ncbi:MAG: NAD(+) diphosphatase [Pseudomonadota bacterium]